MSQIRHRSLPQEPTSGSSGEGVTVSGGPMDEDLNVTQGRGGDSVPVAAEPWRVIGCSVQGASHVRKGLENQDAIRWESEDGRRVVLSVADGHGSPKSFRSARGARFAVDVSLGLASELLKPVRLDLPFVKDRLEQDVPRRVVRDWQACVNADLSESPLTETELLRLEEAAGRKSMEYVEQNPHLAYGSTLLTAIATETFAAFWQIGDGDLLEVSASGKVGHVLPEDEQLVGDETTSLCSSDAWRLFRVAILGTPAPMILLSTDGLSKSFQDDEGFFKFGSDVREMIIAEGLEQVNGRLDGWLREMTKRGSGDDISLGIACRPNAFQPPSPSPPDSQTTGSDSQRAGHDSQPAGMGEMGKASDAAEYRDAAEQKVSSDDEQETLIAPETAPEQANFLVRVLKTLAPGFGAIAHLFRREGPDDATQPEEGQTGSGMTDIG
jgi:hypothetical protein